MNRGEVYRLMGRYEEALADLGRAIALDENVDALANRGVIYQKLGRYEEALANLDRAIALDENDVRAIANRGEVYRLMGRYEEALADFDRAIALNRDVMDSWCNERGLVLSYLGLYPDAIECYEYGLRSSASSNARFPYLYNIAVVMAFWKKFPQAQEYVNKAHAALLAVVNSDAASIRGSALYGLGGLAALARETDVALNYLAQSIELIKDVIVWARHDIAWLYLRDTDPRFQSLVSDESLLER